MLIQEQLESGLWGLGVYAKGTCKEGADFECSEGVCMPCGPAQRTAFAALQKSANATVYALGLNSSASYMTADGKCAGGYLLTVDGRVDLCTRRTCMQVFAHARQAIAVPKALVELTENFYLKRTAKLAVELTEYFDQYRAKVIAEKTPVVVMTPQPSPAPEPLPAPLPAPEPVPTYTSPAPAPAPAPAYTPPPPMPPAPSTILIPPDMAPTKTPAPSAPLPAPTLPPTSVPSAPDVGPLPVYSPAPAPAAPKSHRGLWIAGGALLAAAALGVVISRRR